MGSRAIARQAPSVVASPAASEREPPFARRIVPAATEPALLAVRVDTTALAGSEIAWADLCARTIEPNVFLDPAFALPLLQHAPGARLEFLQVWEEDGPASFGRLVGLFPVVAKGMIAHGFAHPQVACGMPLVDASRADAVVACTLSALAQRSFWLSTLSLTAIPRTGPFRDVLDRVCAQTGRRIVELTAHDRAALYRTPDGVSPPAPQGSSKRRKEFARQVRRLSELGVRTYTTARAPAEVADAMERFLVLEAAGWKGARGTAFAAAGTLATFARTMLRAMAATGRCRIDALEIDGRPVAMGILLRAGDRDHFWKTAFDENLASLSPGVQFATELTLRQLADRTLALTDSCAVADHPMIDRVWHGRLAMADLMVALVPRAPRRFELSVRLEQARRHARHRAKALWLGLRRRAR